MLVIYLSCQNMVNMFITCRVSYLSQVNIGDVGDITKIRLEHDNKNDFPDWHCEKVWKFLFLFTCE